MRLSENIVDIQDNCNLITLHEDSQYPIIWDAENLTIKKIYIEFLSKYQASIDKEYKKKMSKFRINTALNISNCGNYFFLGFDDGILIKLYSKSARFVFDFKSTINESFNSSAILDIFPDLFNNHLIIYLRKDEDDFVIKLDFYSGVELERMKFMYRIKKMFYSKLNNVLAIIDDSNDIHILNSKNFTELRIL